MREASIHISEKNLIRVLQKVLPKGVKADDLAKEILSHGKKYSLTKRNLLVTNKKVAKKADKVILSDIEYAQMFSQLLTTYRRKLNHRGINIIKYGSKDWGQLKEVTKLALDFCEEFQLEKREGFMEYIKIAMTKMTRFGLVKFNNMHQSICENYGATKEIEMDETPQMTHTAHLVYNRLLSDRTGYGYDYRKVPEKYVYFIKAKNEAIRFNVSVEVYIKAQFDGLSYTQGIPDPIQLVGLKAEERLKKYMYTNNIRNHKQVSVNVDWSKIREKKPKRKK